MVTLPDRTALGSRTPRASTPGVSVRPSPVGAALQGFGRSVADLGAGVAAGIDAAENTITDEERFGVETRFLQLEQQWQETVTARQQGTKPGAAGFTDGLRRDFDPSAREFLASVPAPLKASFDMRLTGLEGRILNTGQRFETGEKRRYALAEIDKGLGALGGRLVEQPGSWAEIEAEGVRLIDAAPGLSPIEKDARIADWRTRRARLDAEARIASGDWSGLDHDLGGSPGFRDKVRAVESGGDDQARNPRSTATGPYQFTKGTWLGLMEKYAPIMLGSMSEDDALALRTDERFASAMMDALTSENTEALKAANLPVNDVTLYLAHFAGAGGAVALMQAEPDATAEEVLGANVIRANPFLKGFLASDVIAWAGDKMDRAPAVESVSPRYASLPPEERVARLDAARKGREAEQREERQSYLASFSDYVAAVTSGATVEGGERFSDARLAEMVPDVDEREALRVRRDDALAQAGMARRIQGATPEEIVALRGEIDDLRAPVSGDAEMAAAPGRMQAAAAFEKALRADLKARAEDPAAYALSSPSVSRLAQGEDMARYARATLAEQERLGVPTNARRVLTNTQATATVAEVMRTPPAERGGVVSGMADQWGTAWPSVLGEMRRAGLDAPTYYAAITADDPILSERIAALSGVNNAALAEGLETVEVNDLRLEVFNELEDFRAAFEAGDPTGTAAAEFNKIYEIATGLALQEMRGGNDDAARNAVGRFIGRRYGVIDESNILAYAPARFDPDLIADGAEKALRDERLRAFKPVLGMSPDTPDDVGAARLIQAARRGVWVTNEAADGLVLMIDVDGRQMPLMNEAGERYELSFKAAEMIGSGSVSVRIGD